MLENDSKLGKEEYLALNKTLMVRNVLPVTLGLETVLIFCAIVLSKQGVDTGLGTILTLAAMFFPLLILVTQASVVRRLYKSDQTVQAGAINHYTFYDTYLSVDTQAEHGSSHGEVVYSKLFKAIEEKNYLFLFLNAQNAFIVAKAGFTDGNADELKAILTQNAVKCRFKTKRKQ